MDQLIGAKRPERVFVLADGCQPYDLAGTFKRMLAAADLSRDPSTGQQRTLWSLRHTYATQELLADIDIHTLARHYSKLTATMAAGYLVWWWWVWFIELDKLLN